jgi:hypothetical protein
MGKHVWFSLSLSLSLARSLRRGSHPASCKNNNNKTNNNSDNKPTRRNKKNKRKGKFHSFILEEAAACLTCTKTKKLFSLFASELTDRQTDRQTRRGSRRRWPQSFRSGGSVVSGNVAPAVFLAAHVASAGRVDAVVAVLVAAEEGVGRVQLVSGTAAEKVTELLELLVRAELLPSLRLRLLLFQLLPLFLLLLQQLLLLLFQLLLLQLLLLLLLLKQKKKVILKLPEKER